MSIDIKAFLYVLLAPAAIAGGIGIALKMLLDAGLKRALHKKKAELTAEHASALEVLKSELSRQLTIEKEQLATTHAKDLAVLKDDLSRQTTRDIETFKQTLDAERGKELRLRREAQRWANPILGALDELSHRLFNILNREGYYGLDSSLVASHRTWSMSFDYMMSTTLFLFAQYFCWARLLEAGVSIELFESMAARMTFSKEMFEAVSAPLSDYPLGDSGDSEGAVRDAQVFSLQQRALGEAVTIGNGDERRCMTLHEFLDALEQKKLEMRVDPLRRFLKDIRPSDDDLRWRRLGFLLRNLTNLRTRFVDVLTPSRSVEDPLPEATPTSN